MSIEVERRADDCRDLGMRVAQQVCLWWNRSPHLHELSCECALQTYVFAKIKIYRRSEVRSGSVWKDVICSTGVVSGRKELWKPAVQEEFCEIRKVPHKGCPQRSANFENELVSKTRSIASHRDPSLASRMSLRVTCLSRCQGPKMVHSCPKR